MIIPDILKCMPIMTDWGTEFQGSFQEYCVEKHILMEKSCPYSAWQNGLVERANRTLSGIARAMLLDSQLGPQFWGLALSHAAFMSNRVCHTNTEATPYELVFNRRPNLSKLKVWGCNAKSLRYASTRKTNVHTSALLEVPRRRVTFAGPCHAGPRVDFSPYYELTRKTNHASTRRNWPKNPGNVQADA